MRAIAQGRAKELLSLGGLPIIAHGLRDLARSGIESALIVTSPEKPELAATLGDRCEEMTLHYVEQRAPSGMADALSLAESFARGEPLVCWLPDNVWVGEPATAQLLAALPRAPRSSFVGLRELAAAELGSVGAAGFVDVAGEPLAPDVLRIERVHDKGGAPPRSGAASRGASGGSCPRLKGFPVDLWQPDLFDRIRALRASGGPGELDDTPILQALAREGLLAGVVLRRGRLFDCGVPEGLAAARAALGD